MVVMVADLVNAEASSLDRQCPADNNNEDPISKVEIVGIDDIKSKRDIHGQPSKTIQIGCHSFPLIFTVNLQEKMTEINLNECKCHK